jgi:hypothetical protein
MASATITKPKTPKTIKKGVASVATTVETPMSPEEELQKHFTQLQRYLRSTELPASLVTLFGGDDFEHFAKWSHANGFLPNSRMMLLVRKKQLADSSMAVTCSGWRVKRQLVKSRFSAYTDPAPSTEKPKKPRVKDTTWYADLKWSREQTHIPVTVNGETRILWEWDQEAYNDAAKRFPEVAATKNYTLFSPMRLYTIWRRIQLGWSHEDAVLLPKGKKPEGYEAKPKRRKKK